MSGHHCNQRSGRVGAPSLRTLKHNISIEQLLAARGIVLRRRGDRLVGPCPLHGGDNPTAFVVSRSKNLWYCFTACNAGGDVVELLRRLDGLSYRQVAEQLERLYTRMPIRLETSCTTPARRPPRPSGFHPFTRKLPLDAASPWLRRKGILPAIARRYEAGAYHGRGMLADCVAVRLHDTAGQPLGYAGRRLDPEQVRCWGKWRFPPRLPKSTLLYGYHHVQSERHHGLVVVECPWGVLRLAQLRIPAVALLGISLSQAQLALLQELQRVVLMMDGDAAGSRAAARIEASLRGVEAITVQLPKGYDPDDLSDDELHSALASFFS